jgi:hypothetical protein
MKKLTLSFLLFSFFAIAEEPSRSLWDYHPLHIGGNTIYIGGADVTPRKGNEDGSLHFNKTNAFLFMLVPISEKSYFFPRVEWNTFSMDWDENPKFNQTCFYYMQFGLTFYTIAIDNWRWIMRVDYNMDTQHFLKSSYGLTTGILWGAYQIHRKWHYHVGATGYTGMEGSTLYPIIGADYAPDKKWLFQLIFPINYMIQYQVLDWCKLSIKGRPLRERFRVGKQEPQPRSVFNYSSMGAEFNIFMEKKGRLEVELYGGYNFGGTFYIKDRNGHNGYYTDLGGAPYIGANIDFAF